jgi:hypothetical protein
MRLQSAVLLCVLLWGSLAGAQFVAPGGVVPVVANLPGVNDTYWRSDVEIVNPGPNTAGVRLQLFPEIVGGEAAFEPIVSEEIHVPANGQLTLSNVVQSRFQQVNVKGALWVYSTDFSDLVVASRTYTTGDVGGTYGQDVNGIPVAAQAWAAGLRNDGFYRTNVGIFWPWDLPEGESVDFQVTVFDGDGDQAGSGTVRFDRAGLKQISLSNLGVDLLLDGFAVIACSDVQSLWYAYASRVDQVTGDAVFRIARGYQVEGK